MALPGAQPVRGPSLRTHGEGEQILGTVRRTVDAHAVLGAASASEVGDHMTRDRDFKDLVRQRMGRTGENYTTARLALLAQESPPSAEFAAAAREQQVIVDRWFVGGRLRGIPARHKVRAAVLLEVLSTLEPGRVYDERSISAHLAGIHEDFAHLRRELVGLGYVERHEQRYRVCPSPPVRSRRRSAELPAWERVWLPTFVARRTAPMSELSS